jgi:hypothetical protein
MGKRGMLYWSRGVFALLAISSGTSVASAQQPAAQSPIAYPTVAEALQALQHKNGVRISNQGGWTVIDDPSEQTLWSFRATRTSGLSCRSPSTNHQREQWYLLQDEHFMPSREAAL